MKTYIAIFLIAAFSFCNTMGAATPEPPKKGFNYKAHKQMNKKANRWGKKRMKAANYNLLNIKCDAKDSRKYAKRQKG
ncbi:MAG: hypothetical protein SH856_07870 [Flavobacteriales bacterium]|nr:hypothetical protein [Flavobacteriales bacterium]